MGFTQDELEAYRDGTVTDLAGDGMRLLFVGINPGLWTAAVDAHFARRGNRFWPAVHRAGLTSAEVDAADGMPDWAREELLDRGVGITNLVGRATARADELEPGELEEGADELAAFVEEWSPRVVAILGITAYRTAFSEPGASRGRQDRTIGEASVWLLGNPSGLNAHENVDSLAESFRTAAQEAGVPLDREA